MQKDIHPKYSEFTIHIGDIKFKTMSCCPKSTYVVDRDFRKHPAWTKKGILTTDAISDSIDTYKKKYGDLGF